MNLSFKSKLQCDRKVLNPWERCHSYKMAIPLSIDHIFLDDLQDGFVNQHVPVDHFRPLYSLCLSLQSIWCFNSTNSWLGGQSIRLGGHCIITAHKIAPWRKGLTYIWTSVYTRMWSTSKIDILCNEAQRLQFFQFHWLRSKDSSNAQMIITFDFHSEWLRAHFLFTQHHLNNISKHFSVLLVAWGLEAKLTGKMIY